LFVATICGNELTINNGELSTIVLVYFKGKDFGFDFKIWLGDLVDLAQCQNVLGLNMTDVLFLVSCLNVYGKDKADQHLFQIIIYILVNPTVLCGCIKSLYQPEKVLELTRHYVTASVPTVLFKKPPNAR
jgi:hypothetical protein